jgi:hypothetical protein
MSRTMNGNDLAKLLTRAVVRAFYETRHVLIIECLLNYSAYGFSSALEHRLGLAANHFQTARR